MPQGRILGTAPTTVFGVLNLRRTMIDFVSRAVPMVISKSSVSNISNWHAFDWDDEDIVSHRVNTRSTRIRSTKGSFSRKRNQISYAARPTDGNRWWTLSARSMSDHDHTKKSSANDNYWTQPSGSTDSIETCLNRWVYRRCHDDHSLLTLSLSLTLWWFYKNIQYFEWKEWKYVYSFIFAVTFSLLLRLLLTCACVYVFSVLFQWNISMPFV